MRISGKQQLKKQNSRFKDDLEKNLSQYDINIFCESLVSCVIGQLTNPPLPAELKYKIVHEIKKGPDFSFEEMFDLFKKLRSINKQTAHKFGISKSVYIDQYNDLYHFIKFEADGILKAFTPKNNKTYYTPDIVDPIVQDLKIFTEKEEFNKNSFPNLKRVEIHSEFLNGKSFTGIEDISIIASLNNFNPSVLHKYISHLRWIGLKKRRFI